MKRFTFRQKQAAIGVGMILISLLYIFGGIYLAKGEDQTIYTATGIGLFVFSLWFLYDQLA